MLIWHCSRGQGLLMNCNKMCAEYLFQQDKHYDTGFDTGDKVIQCGRHNDIFKLWLLWRAKVNDARLEPAVGITSGFFCFFFFAGLKPFPPVQIIAGLWNVG